jgi:translation elongation factor P (EF-P)
MREIMGSTQDFRPGLIIRFNNELYQIIEFQHVNPGNWRAFVRTKLKNIKTGRVIENRFRAGESVDIVRVERHQFQYLYKDGDFLVLMNTENFDQISVPEEMLGEGIKFLKEGITLDLLMDGSRIVSAELPIFVELKVVQTEPGIKGDTATGGSKPATLETGAVVTVPLFIDEGDIVKIDTRNGEYVERVKER